MYAYVYIAQKTETSARFFVVYILDTYVYVWLIKWQ